MFGLSKEQSSFSRTNRCPLCHKFPVLPKYSKSDGTRISRMTLLPMMDRSAIATCPRCKGQWPVWAPGKSTATIQPAEPAAAPAAAPAPAVPAAPAAPPVPTDVRIVETERTIEDYYVEPMELDNLRGTTSLAREVTINEKWVETYVVEAEQARTVAGDGELGLGGVGSLKLSGEQALTRKYSATQGTERTYTDRITIEVPARTKRVVSFIYRLVWQHGLIVFQAGDQQVEVPFKVAIDLNLDLAQEDSTGAG